mgnify:CR=1 FL=1
MKKSQEKPRFFKLIMMQDSFFADTYNIDSPDDIYPGQCFFAKGKQFEWCTHTDSIGFCHPKVCLWNEWPLIHFCDNAIDLLMWYKIGLHDENWFREIYFYEITPSLPYYKERCKDKNRLFQCGARGIKIIRHLTMDDVLRIAKKEINNNIEEIINRYPDQNMMKLILYVQENAKNKR